MCGRFPLGVPREQLELDFGLDDCADYPIRHNISPGTDIAVIRQSPEGRRVLHLLRWGLIPRWIEDVKTAPKLNNARGESVAEKPSFKSAFKSRRCLIPASGFYEWQAQGQGPKQPYFISLKSGKPIAMAGLWESKEFADGSILRTACVITTAANELMAPIHDRMPVIISPENWQAWLTAPADSAKELITPFAPEQMQAWPVSRRVSRSSEEGPDLIERVALAG